MLAKDARYSQDTENLKKTAAEREFNLSNQMDEIKKESLARAEAVSRLEEKVKELGLAIEKLSEQNIKLSAENEKLKKLTDSHTHEIPEVAGGTR